MLPYQNLSLEDMPGEVWRDIPGWDGYYQVSNMGRAKSIGRILPARGGKTRILKTHILKQSLIYGRRYLSFSARKENKTVRFYVHRIVCTIFNPNPEGKPCVDHINTNTFDNRSQNLRWVTYHENSSNPLTKYHTSLSKSGEKCFFFGKVFGARAIIVTFQDGSEERFSSIRDACRKYAFNYRGAQGCLCGRHSHHHGCKFRYAD